MAGEEEEAGEEEGGGIKKKFLLSILSKYVPPLYISLLYVILYHPFMSYIASFYDLKTRKKFN